MSGLVPSLTPPPSQVIGGLWVPESADCVRCEMRSFRLNALNKSTAEQGPAEEVDRLNPENMWSLTPTNMVPVRSGHAWPCVEGDQFQGSDIIHVSILQLRVKTECQFLHSHNLL